VKIKIPIGAIAEPGSSVATKTGSWRTEKPEYTGEKPCTGCQSCVRACPEGAVTVEDKHFVVDLDFCKGCALCVAVCPIKGLSMEEEVR
jgi:pyruvate ferredoxin oxidoreductase delta subunit